MNVELQEKILKIVERAGVSGISRRDLFKQLCLWREDAEKAMATFVELKNVGYILQRSDGNGIRIAPKIVKYDDPLEAIRVEYLSACDKFPAFNSAHEGYAVILEELEELWEHVKTNAKYRDIPEMRQEAIQVAAMVLRFAVDICW